MTTRLGCLLASRIRQDAEIAELPMQLERTPEPRRLSESYRGYAEPRRLLWRLPRPYHLRATKGHRIASKNLVTAVLYDAAEPGVKQSREAGTRWKVSEDAAGPREWRRSVPQMRGRRHERS